MHQGEKGGLVVPIVCGFLFIIMENQRASSCG
jgi:hypothetical protein